MVEMLGSYEVLDRLSTKANRELIIEYQKTGSSEVLYKIFQHNLYLVKSAMQNLEVFVLSNDIDDYLQEAFLVLVESLSKYNPNTDESGSLFCIYFYSSISRRIVAKFCSDRYPNVSARSAKLAYKVAETGYMADAERVMYKFNINARQYNDLIAVIYKLGILDEEDFCVYSDSDKDEFGCLSKLVMKTGEVDLENLNLSHDCSKFMGKLRRYCTDREWGIFTTLYPLEGGTKLTLEECGNIFGITKECARQAKLRVLRKVYHNKELYRMIENYR